ncbi:YfhO family protein [Staphylococcus lugdunensis]|uniref:Bacterial membrane protein YfhO n=1 Tax=Staphylococcus lugdunensis TaxID=28035 RepID=A0A4Q9WAS0_STALU|nr:MULTISPECIES: YfhO family protein [Staphylococcus]AMG60870.1 hypothetical protein AL499_02625 [Staphylococcus lugdunensis]ARJ11686.1 hypothetical protein B7466_07825 [Staphylococcus lugdunensis]AST59863.1 hypothetical protein BFP67_03325 [Staphylococcus lugdunensis]ATG69111.1 hypothetical protein CPG32_05645 [Staphylococcus lugdunensis]ATN14363.1 hypothetical protein CRN64_02690 [Staphylococcus lugdunensis]
MTKKLLMIMLFLTLAIIGHTYILYRFIHDGILFTGPNDGIEQMIPMQMYLYDKWSQGQFFYATDFGLGGDFFSDLSYYFSTNLLFIINAIIIYITNLIVSLPTGNVTFWTINAIVISIVKATIAMLVTYLFSMRIVKHRVNSSLIAFLFVMSPLYYRFTVYWPFFSDVFIGLHLLLYAIEHMLQQKKIGLLILAITIIMINNFYFAYYFLLIGAGYLLIRITFPHKDDRMKRITALWLSVLCAFLGLANALFMFYYSAQSYINNRRIPYKDHVPVFESLNINNNIFIDNYLIILLFITIQALLTFKLYKHYYFRLFAFLTCITILFNFMPIVDQIFNGFSAPQKRWHFLLAFNSAMVIGLFIKYFSTIRLKTYIWTNIVAQSAVFISVIVYHQYVPWLVLVPIVSLIGLFTLIIKDATSRLIIKQIYVFSIISLSILVSAVFIKNQIYFKDHEQRANNMYIHSSLYNSELQRQLLSYMTHTKEPWERIDWRVNEQDNTPMYQKFKGLSLYSSIFHHNILDLYYDDLKINLAEESLSRYQSTNGRQNIASLFSVRYMMLKDYQNNLPAYFQKIKSSGQYAIYENKLNLPAVKVTNHLYNDQSIKTSIDREHAMLDGVIVHNGGNNYRKHSKNLLNKVSQSSQHIQCLSNKHIKVNSQQGGMIKLHVPKSIRQHYTDFYLTMYIKRGQPDSNYSVAINGYVNHRLYNQSTYRTGVNTQLYRTQPDENGNISIQLTPSGTFDMKLISLHGENYHKLVQTHRQANFDHRYQDIHDGVRITLAPHSQGMAVVNIPYRKGMMAYVDGKRINPIRVNTMMTGIPVKKSTTSIIIKYLPPHWIVMLLLSSISILCSIMITRIFTKKRKDEE